MIPIRMGLSRAWTLTWPGWALSPLGTIWTELPFSGLPQLTSPLAYEHILYMWPYFFRFLSRFANHFDFFKLGVLISYNRFCHFQVVLCMCVCVRAHYCHVFLECSSPWPPAKWGRPQIEQQGPLTCQACGKQYIQQWPKQVQFLPLWSLWSGVDTDINKITTQITVRDFRNAVKGCHGPPNEHHLL